MVNVPQEAPLVVIREKTKRKHATRIADMLLERLKDQGKVEEDANEEG